MGGPDFDGLIPGPDNYDEKSDHIEIPHGRSNMGTDALTEGRRSILRSELWKLIRVARIARPVAI